MITNSIHLRQTYNALLPFPRSTKSKSQPKPNPFLFLPLPPPPPPNPRTNPFETKLSSNFVQLQPPSARPSIRPMKNNQQPLASVLAETKTSSFGRGGGDTGRKGGGEWSWPSEGRGISRPRLGWAN